MKHINLVTNQLFKLILGSSQYFFFLFAPCYFIIQLLGNLLGVTNPLLFLILTLVVSLTWFYRAFEEVYRNTIKPSPLAIFSISLATLLLTFITLTVGIDDSTDTYFYHLNITIPLALHHDLLNTHGYDLIGYSQGYPKFGELLQALWVQLTGQFWSYGLASVWVIPASYGTTYLLARQVGLDKSAADVVGLLYAFNPVNITQATTGYIDSIQSLYVLGCLLLMMKATQLPRLALIFLNLVAMLNIKFTGILLGSVLLGVGMIWQRQVIFRQDQRWPSLSLILAFGFLGIFHYLANWVNFGTPIFPFIDLPLAQYMSQVYVESSSIMGRIMALFWSWPTPFATISWYDLPTGAFSLLWYPLPLFIVIAIVQAIRSKNFIFLGIQFILWSLLILDPAITLGRYVAYFQVAGLVALVYVLKRWVGGLSSRLQWLVLYSWPLAYLGLSSYIVLNPELGMIQRRVTQSEQQRLWLDSADSTLRQTFEYFYEVNSFCSGYYWLWRYKQVPVKLIQGLPTVENYLYLHRNAANQCVVGVHHNFKAEIRPYRVNEADYVDLTVINPAALTYCKQCVSEYGCTYVPFYVYKHTQELSHQFPFKTKGDKELSIECQTIDGQSLKQVIKFQAK